MGHLAATPQYYRINGQRVVAHTPADYLVLPQYGFHAILLMQKLIRTCQNCVACDRVHEAIKIETRLGAEVAGDLRYAVKLLDVSRLSDLPVPIPKPILKLPGWGLRTIDGALSSSLLGDTLEVEMLGGFDESFDELFEKIATVVPCLSEKDSSFLHWRYGPGSPQTPVSVLGVRSGKELLGYAVLRVSENQNAYILDLTTLPGRHDVARALLRGALRFFRRARPPSIRYRFLESSTSPRTKDLWRLGFFFTHKRNYSLLVKFMERDLHGAANDTARWSYSFGDGEPSFWGI